jgi:hypothetical protein
VSIELPVYGQAAYNPARVFPSFFDKQRGDRMRLFAGFKGFLGLAMVLLCSTAPTVRADEGSDAPARDATEAATDDGTEIAPVQAASRESHRRRTEKGRSALVRPVAPRQASSETADTPLERLQELCSGEVVLQPIIVRSTLAEAMRRVALWGDCCPICGHPQAEKGRLSTESSSAADPIRTQRKLLDVDVDDAKCATAEAAPLRPGEPAQVILDTQKRLGKSVTDGTEFGGSPDLLIQWIRTLDEENRRRQLALEVETSDEPLEASPGDGPITPRSQVDALRLACRQLQEAADVLEDQNLFESADSIRGFADVLRRQSRQKVSQLSPSEDDAPVTAPRHASSKR